MLTQFTDASVALGGDELDRTIASMQVKKP